MRSDNWSAGPEQAGLAAEPWASLLVPHRRRARVRRS